MDPVVNTALPGKSSVVIIGGGIIGVSILYHLAKRGITDAILVERKKLASGTTWHAAGIVGQLRESSSQTELAKYTARLFGELENETGQATGYKQNGTINLALSEVRLEQLLRNRDHAQRMNIDAHLLTPEELQESWPWIEYQGVLGGLRVPSNGQVNSMDVTQALAKGARKHGCSIFENTQALRMVAINGRVVAVETDKGVVATSKVVLAGGMWTQRFAKAHGVTVPLHAAEHVYLVTEPIPDLARDLPCLIIGEERTYFKEDAGKLLIGAFERRGKPWGQHGIPESFEFDELPFDMDHLLPMLEGLFTRMPLLENLGIKTYFCGPESFTPDGRPYLGPAPELNGLYIAAGMNSNGILNSGGVGLTMAEWILDGLPRKSMGSLLASRAHPFQSNQMYLEERTQESLGLHYGLQWPGRQMETARGVRRIPLHGRLKQAGAVFAERIGWEVPMYYDPTGKSWPDRASLGHQDWSPQVEAECLAARDSVVLIDQSMYGKIIVQGPNAVDALNRVCGAELDVAVGVSVYTQFLNAIGGIEADNTITRLDTNCFLVVTGHPSQIRDQAWIKMHAQEDWRFEVFDATSAYALLSLHGPKARALLQTLSRDDLSCENFAFGAAKQMDIAHARSWVIRRSFLGECGFELLISTEFAEGVYEQIISAGEHFGLRRSGMFALNHCRMEKAFRHFGHDIGEEDTPFETGLGFAVNTQKISAFLGQDRLRTQKAMGEKLPYRTVAAAVVGADKFKGPFLIHNETIWKQNELVGHVTSGAWGYRTNLSLGLASLHQTDGVTKEWINEGGFEVQIAGLRHQLKVQLQPFYDPAALRMKA
jgi:glycine cleavage system aminomethyltransferase T/glycine/D-amino acid oxidase-like deaminating enzyme